MTSLKKPQVTRLSGHHTAEDGVLIFDGCLQHNLLGLLEICTIPQQLCGQCLPFDRGVKIRIGTGPHRVYLLHLRVVVRLNQRSTTLWHHAVATVPA